MAGEPGAVVASVPFRQPRPRLRWLALALAVVGWWVSLNLFMAALNPAASNAFLDALCSGGGQTGAGAPAGDCRAVLSSPWGYVKLSKQPGAPRLPVSVLGMGYFALVGLWYLLVGPATRGRGAYHLLILAAVLVGAGYSLYFMHVMSSVLHRWCGGCLVVHAANIVLLGLTIAAWPWGRGDTGVQAHPSGRLALAAMTAGLLALFSHLAAGFILVTGEVNRQNRDNYLRIVGDPNYVEWNHARQPVVELPLREDEVFLGARGAAHTVVIFSDFQCPACRQAHAVLDQVVQRYPGALRVAFRYFPQDAACNPLPMFQEGRHPAACAAARACEAAYVVGGADAALAMRKLLYVRQNELEQNRFEQWAQELKLDAAAFRAAVESARVQERIKRDVDLGVALGLSGMPIVYLDNRKVEGWSNERVWERLLGVTTSAPTSAPGEAEEAGR
jgi:protein-disulfide isomerase/uncharacterized membrane protein